MARVNLSHGTQKQNLKLISKFKQAKRLRPHKNCALMLEVRGREIRISQFNDPKGEVRVRSGASVKMTGGEYHIASDANNLRISCDIIQNHLKPNDVIYFDDGKAVGIVQEIFEKGIKMEMKIGGYIKSRCAVRVTAGKHSNLKLVTADDIRDLQAISQMILVDFIAIPFISTKADIAQIKELLGETGRNINIMAKIDTIDAIHQYDEIVMEADGVIFVRNELQWELQAEKLVLAQKWAIEQANNAAKPIII